MTTVSKDTSKASLRPAWRGRASDKHTERETTMNAWAWVGVGLAAFCVISTLAGLAIAAILGRIGEEASRLLEAEAWSRPSTGREQVGAARGAERRSEEPTAARRPGPPSRYAVSAPATSGRFSHGAKRLQSLLGAVGREGRETAGGH